MYHLVDVQMYNEYTRLSGAVKTLTLGKIAQQARSPTANAPHCSDFGVSVTIDQNSTSFGLRRLPMTTSVQPYHQPGDQSMNQDHRSVTYE